MMLCSQGYASTILNYFQMINCSYYICREALQLKWFYFSYIYLFCFFPWNGRDNCVVVLCRMHANIFRQALFTRLCFSSDLGIPEATNMHSNLCSWQATWWKSLRKIHSRYRRSSKLFQNKPDHFTWHLLSI